MGLTPPSVSTLVDGLIERGMMTREEHPTDRRRVRLAVTSHGRAILETATRETLTYLAKKLSNVTPDNREVIAKAMEILRMTFAGSVRS
jgi:DNA-binding MarR family transcriptional regulator